MKKYIILSVNDNPKYLFHVPLTVWAWRKIGWTPAIFFHGRIGGMLDVVAEYIDDNIKDWFNWVKVNGYQSETITQVSRLYAGCIVDTHDMIMTGDIDMIPLSDYWHPAPDKLTVYGRDLTDYHYPICYIAMDGYKWAEVMNLINFDYDQHIKRDLDSLPQAKSQDKVKRWVTDQDLITDRINNSKFVPERVDRGMYKNGYPLGRVDRSAWTLDHKQFIDAHLPHDILTNEQSFKKALELLHLVWPKEDWKWYINYYKEFKKMMK